MTRIGLAPISLGKCRLSTDLGQIERDVVAHRPPSCVLIHANGSAHAPGAKAADIELCDQHAAELVGADSMVVAYGRQPRASRRWGVEVRPVHRGGVVERTAE